MGFTFIPEYYFDTFNEATAEFLVSIGVKGIVLDVDNTLEPYENPLPGEHVKAWLSQLNEKGISAAIVSNNGKDRINLFNSELGLPVYYKAKKPFKKNVLRAMADMGTDMGNTILMGDQIFTDVWAAHNTGIRAILVPPIKDKRDILTRFKRLLERPILNKHNKIKNQDLNLGRK
jgi:HAD superfamily phosphatase (TIGR01668 family)